MISVDPMINRLVKYVIPVDLASNHKDGSSSLVIPDPDPRVLDPDPDLRSVHMSVGDQPINSRMAILHLTSQSAHTLAARRVGICPTRI